MRVGFRADVLHPTCPLKTFAIIMEYLWHIFWDYEMNIKTYLNSIEADLKRGKVTELSHILSLDWLSIPALPTSPSIMLIHWVIVLDTGSLCKYDLRIHRKIMSFDGIKYA